MTGEPERAMRTITTNYGLAGGKLDCTEHLAAGITRLLSLPEIVMYVQREYQAAVVSKAKRDCAESN